MKKNVLVTLADANYVEQAKQLFSSVYWNAGWDGDYLLLAHEIPEEKLLWFRNKGIFVYECIPFKKKSIKSRYPSTVASKFYLFDEFFKRWKKIIFLDGDIIVTGSLDELKNTQGFSAKSDFGMLDLDWQTNYDFRKVNLNREQMLRNKLTNLYDMNSVSFNSGVMVIDSDIIESDSLDKLLVLWNEYKDLSLFGEQLVLNLFMYGNWKQLPNRFNCYILNLNSRQSRFFLHSGTVSPILHFVGKTKVWHKKNLFTPIWKSNLVRAESIDLTCIPSVNRIHSKEDIQKSEELIFIKEMTLAKKIFPKSFNHIFIKKLDRYYEEGMMKEFRRFLLSIIFIEYNNRYIRYMPYFFISFIPLRSKFLIKKLFF